MVYSRKGKLSDSQTIGDTEKERLKMKNQELLFGTPKKDVRLKPSAIQKVTSVTNLEHTSLRALAPQTKLKCKKSLSLQDLSPSFQKHLAKRRGHLCPKAEPASPIMIEDATLPDERYKVLAYRVLHRFIRNAFRRQKDELEVKDIYIKSTTSQVTNLKLQVSTLKALLKSDEQVISNSFKEIHSLKSLLATLQDKYSAAKKEKEDVQRILDSTKDEISQLRTEFLNNKNALIMAQNESSAYEAQLQKEREKITKLKNDNRLLLDKVDDLSVNLKLKTEKMKNIEYTVNQLHQQANDHMSLLRSAQQKIDQDERALEEASGCLKDLKKELGDAVIRERNLKAQAEEFSLKMADQANNFEKVLKERTLKIVELETVLAMSEPQPFLTRMIKVATDVISVPLVVLEALNSSG